MGVCKSQVHQLLIGVVTLFALLTSYAMFSIDMPNMIYDMSVFRDIFIENLLFLLFISQVTLRLINMTTEFLSDLADFDSQLF